MVMTYKVAITDYVKSPAEIEREVLGRDLVFLEGRDLAQSYVDTRGIEALLVWHQRIDQSYLDFFEDLKVVVRYGVGYDNIDLDELRRRQIPFLNTPDYGTEEVADTAVAMILCAARGIVAYDSACRHYASDTWQEQRFDAMKRSNQTTIGIVGAGRIGSAVIRRLRGFDFQILGYDPHLPSGHEKSIGYQRTHHLGELLAQSDIISLHCPLSAETLGMVDRAFVGEMKTGSVLVNTARGELVKHLDVLQEGLSSNQLSSVYLDVLPNEPVDRSHSLIKAWLSHEAWLRGRLVINPHTAFYSQSAWHEMRYKCAESAKLYLEQGLLRNQIV